MKLDNGNKKFNGERFGFMFKEGVADVPKEQEDDARRIASLIGGYKIVEDKPKKEPKEEPKEEPKKAAPKKAATKKTTKKKADEDK